MVKAVCVALTIGAIGLCALAFAGSCTTVLLESFDTGWLIRTGQIVLSSGIPRHDPFSWTLPDRSVISYQWLFEVFSGFLYNNGGLWLLALVCTIFSGLIYLYYLPRQWINLGIPALVPFFALSFAFTPHWFNARPQLISYALMLMLISILERYRKGDSRRWIYALCPLCIVWVNAHAFWIYGLILMGIYAVADIIRTKRWTSLASLLIACAACTLINPFGLHLIAYVLSFADSSQYLGMRETQPALTCMDCLPAFCLLAIGVGLVWKNRSKVPVEGVIVCTVLLVAAAMIRRYESLAVIVSWRYIGMALSEFDFSAVASGKFADLILPRRVHHLIVALVVTVVSFCKHYPTEARCEGIFFEGSKATLSFAANHIDSRTPLFNDATTGSWLILIGSPKVFIDTRYDTYPKSFCCEALDVLVADPSWEKKLDDKKVGVLLVRNEFSALRTALNASPQWLPAIDDGTLALWIRNDARANALLREWTLTDEALGTMTELPDYARDTTRKTRANCFYHRAMMFLDGKHAELAMPLLRQCSVLFPDNERIQTMMDEAAKQFASTHHLDLRSQ